MGWYELEWVVMKWVVRVGWSENLFHFVEMGWNELEWVEMSCNGSG